MFKALLYAYILGGLTFIPLLIGTFIFVAIYTSVPVGDRDVTKRRKRTLEAQSADERTTTEEDILDAEMHDIPKTRKGWLTMRRTFEEQPGDTGYVTLVRSLLDARSKDPKRSKPKDMWYVVLKGKVLYLYEDEDMTECEAAIELSGHDIVIFPEGLLDGELFAKRNAICLKPKMPTETMPSVTQEMKLEGENVDEKLDQSGISGKKREKEREKLVEIEKKMDAAREEALDPSTPWFIFVRSNVEMEDWYFALVHASDHPNQTPTLAPLREVFDPLHMNHLVSTLDEQPDVIPMRWLNALLGRIFFSYYRTQNLESYIIGRLMKKLSKVKRPTFLTDIVVTEVSVGDKAPMLSKPMLKELTKEGDASLEVHLQYKGEVRITVEATATINLGARFKPYTVKLVLAAVLKELEGNLLIKVKRPPSNRIWYAFTQTPRMVLEVEPIVSDRQITWNMILSTIESKFKEIIQESVVMPNMDDIAFFESIPYQRRGGIWSDASRKQTQSPSTDEETSEKDQSSKPPGIPDITTTAPSAGETAPALPPHSLSDTELQSEIPSSPPPTQINRASSTTPTIDDSPESKTNARRRSWFSSVRSEDLSTPSYIGESQVGTSADEDDRRGRTTESEKSPSLRSHSTPSKAESVHSSTADSSGPDESESHSQNSLSPNGSRRSASQHSVKREHEANELDSLSNGRPLSTPSTPRKVSDASQTPSISRASSPTSFFSTLKSKAGDKQAISNTAKEAMRKWGVNWGGLKKDSGGASNSDDGSDAGSISSRLRAGADSLSTSIQNQRTSYMEVRAAVAERKEREERERQAQVEETSEAPRATSLIPSSDGRKGDGTTSHGSSIPQPNAPSQSTEGSAPTTPAAPRLSAPTLSSKKSSSSIPVANADKSAEDLSTSDKTTHAPIHVQPQAKTMTIPGIHASHRGEVMSMGYSAPQPPPPPASESKLKNPAIQTVYRLWKSPVLSAAGQEQETPPALQSQQELHLEVDAKDKDITPLALSPNVHQASSQPSTRPAPPPLPPRSTPITIARPTLDNSQIPSSVSPPSSATEVLKSIATKDENTRTQASLDQAQSQSPSSRRSSIRVVNTTDAGLDKDVPRSSTDQAPVSTAAPAQLVPPPLPPRRTQTSTSS